MSYLNLFSLHNLAMLSDWLAEIGELFVHIYFPHRAGFNTGYFIYSLQDLKLVVLAQDWHEIEFTVFRRKQNSLRGIASEQLLEQALQQIPENKYFSIFPLSDDLTWCHCVGYGQGHVELRSELADSYGEPVVVVEEPQQSGVNETLVVEKTVFNQFQVKRNQDYYELFSRHPERYESIAQLWRE